MGGSVSYSPPAESRDVLGNMHTDVEAKVGRIWPSPDSVRYYVQGLSLESIPAGRFLRRAGRVLSLGRGGLRLIVRYSCTTGNGTILYDSTCAPLKSVFEISGQGLLGANAFD